ncbi:PREDICTED: uncharacterized protein LOC109131263 [Camelina sativa]|uniref:Uncharacterized protein LOC109131263 n=1 Tax=Camelina sativa TaxID=90675 RepID=A0ABM1RES3_CAMSA|nr:PREDICTED: uncharacterized protein LOC109131263 [Camelina sativa]
MSKAYDRLEWDFIEAALKQMGFHPTWVNWIIQCVSTVSYSYLVNGQAQGIVNPRREIRQGDPLSPYLFIICSEVLSGLCLKAQSQGNLLGLRVAKGSPRVNHLLFADDTMFFIRSDYHSCMTLRRILQKYEAASGQKINQAKSSITFSAKTPASAKELAKNILEIQKEGGQGKLTMLKSVLTTMPTYTMSCFQLPASLCKRIQSALTRFWWDKNTEKKKMSWIAWRKLAKPAKMGGLGLRDIKLFNKALLAKLSWRILTNPQSLLARVLKGKYCKDLSFLDSSAPNSASHGWKSICIGKDLLKNNLGVLVGSGDCTRLWRSPWLSLSSPLAPMGPPTKATQHLTVADLIIPGTNEWNSNLIRNILPMYEDVIKKIKPSGQGARDTWAWLPTKDGQYSAKSGYFETKLLIWKAVQNALPVGVNLKYRNITDSAVCPHCSEEESVLHLLFLCPYAKSIWSAAPFQTKPHLESIKDVNQGIEKVNNLLCLPPTGIGSGPLAPWIIWSIWTARNQLIFSKKQIPGEEALHLAMIRAKEWQAAQIPALSPPQDPQSSDQTSEPPRDIPRFGWIIKNAEGQVTIRGTASSSHINSPLMAEAAATLIAIRVAIESGIDSIAFASDSQMLVKALNQKLQIKELHGTLHDVFALSASLNFVSFNFISRTLNRQADALAKKALGLLCNNT